MNMSATSKLTLVAATTLALCAALVVTQGQTKEASRYPNELAGFRLYENSKWKTLVPLSSTMADARRALGNPQEARDLSSYTKPYPGDAAAKQPVFSYEYGDWQILLYFVKYCFYQGPKLPDKLNDLVCSIDL